jgi:hypothetical protein
MSDVGHHESPCEIPAESQVQAEGPQSVGRDCRDGCTFSCTEVVVDAFLASWKDPAGLHTEVRTHVYQELSFTEPVRDEEAVCWCSVDMCRC